MRRGARLRATAGGERRRLPPGAARRLPEAGEGTGRLGVGSRFQGVNLEGAAPGSRGVGQGLGVPRKRAAGREGAERGSGCTSASRGRILKATCPKASSLHLKRQKGLNTIPSLPRGGLALRTLFRADLE